MQVGTAATRQDQKSTTPSFEVGPVPSWVQPVVASNEIEPGENSGTAYLLIDRQENIERRAFYYHEVRKITSANGLQNGTSIYASFNSSFEKLVWHSIRVIRDAKTSNRLDVSKIKVVPFETNPDRLTYNVSYSTQISLDDVRVGDIIEFAWTTEGANPLSRGKYFGTYSLQGTHPIMRNALRLVYPANRKLALRPVNGATPPTLNTVNGVTELLYEEKNVPGRKIEDDVPDDFSPRRQLQLTEFHDWAEVVRWTMPLFEIDVARSPEFNAETDKLRAISDPEQRVVTALQFVQDEIRYVGARRWVGTQPLTSPDVILRRRLANDQDKALLLLMLLRQTGIDAAPALVSESYRSGVREQLPSPQIFDHVIVQVRLGPATHWIDPSRGPQRGPLSQIYVARYDYALVLRPDATDLTTFHPPQESLPVRKVVENIRVPAPENDGELEVISECRGLTADRIRSWFRETSREEIQKQYLQYYERSFPDAKVQKLVWYEELPGENACIVTESYTIPKIWQLSDEKDRYTLHVQPDDVYSAIGPTTSLKRDDPLKLDYPNTVFEEINVEMFEDWPFNGKGENVTNDFFRLRDEPNASGSHIQLNYSYEALKDRVEVNELQRFNDAVSKAKDNLGYSLTYRTPEQLAQNKSRAGFNWAIAAAALSFFGTATFLAYRYFRDSTLASPVPPPIDAPARLTGIGGWLILLAIGQVLRPISYIKTGFDLYPTMMDTNSWASLTDPIVSTYHAWWAPTLLFELLFDIVALVFCALLIALFFAKRAAWPRCFAVFLILSIVGTALDSYLVDRIPAAGEPLMTSIRDIGAAVLAAAIWIPYVYQSKRVKATFRY